MNIKVPIQTSRTTLLDTKSIKKLQQIDGLIPKDFKDQKTLKIRQLTLARNTLARRPLLSWTTNKLPIRDMPKDKGGTSGNGNDISITMRLAPQSKNVLAS